MIFCAADDRTSEYVRRARTSKPRTYYKQQKHHTNASNAVQDIGSTRLEWSTARHFSGTRRAGMAFQVVSYGRRDVG